MSGIVVVGAGRMGRGIAQVFAYAGRPVTIVDMKPRDMEDRLRLLTDARNEIRQNLVFLADLGVFEPARIEAIMTLVETLGPDEAAASLKTAEIIFEAVTETVEAKRDVFARLASLLPADALVASTTSTLPVEDLADLVDRPERFVNAHWLNPAYLIPLVEVSPGGQTAPATTDRLCELLERVGKVPVRCKASPGYIVPRIQALAMNEAARMVDEGVASAEDIDKAVRYGFGIRYATMGLVEFIDWGGCDILYYASRHLTEGLGSDRHQVAPSVERHMTQGKLGMNAGQGFYDFRHIDVEAYRRRKLSEFVALLDHMNCLPKPGV